MDENLTEEERLQELEAKAERADELERLLQEKEEELEKERAKDKNFQKVREIEKAKREGVKTGLSKEIEDLRVQMDKERENRQELQGMMLKESTENALKSLAGDDADLRQKLIDRVKESEVFLGAPKDSGELVSRYEKAFSYIAGTQKKVSPLNAYYPATTVVDDSIQGKRFTGTADGKTIIETKFAKELAKVKRVNPNFNL